MATPTKYIQHQLEAAGIDLARVSGAEYPQWKPLLTNGLKVGDTDLTAAELEAFILSADAATGIVSVTAGTTHTQGGATALTGTFNLVTTGNAGDGAILPLATGVSQRIYVKNISAVALSLYPNTSDTINGGSANAAVTVQAGTVVLCVSTGTTDWTVMALVTLAQSSALAVTLGAATASKLVSLDANSWFDGTKLQGWDYSLAAAGSAFAPSSSTEAKMNLGGYTIAANRLQALGVIEFEAVAKIGAINATDTFTLNVRLGAADDATGTVVAVKVLGATAAADDYAIVRGKISVRSIVTTTCTLTSNYVAGGLLAGAAENDNSGFIGAFTKDSTAALYLNACGKWSTNSATNSATLQDFKVRVLGA